MGEEMKKQYLHPYSEPPYTNRGVGHTWDSGLRACVDWLQATFKIVSPNQLITDVLQMDLNGFFPSTGKYGYKKSFKCGSITIYFDGTEEMGTHIVMKGRGCREYERYGKRNWKELLQTIFEYQGSFTRLDIAVDDFEGIFTVKGLVRKVKSRELISKFKRAKNVEDIEIKTGKIHGVTLYFGSGKSDVQIRVYDKLSERKDGNYNVSEDIKVWNRTEIQLRDEKATFVADVLARKEAGESSIGETVCGILKDYLRFTVKGKDTNRSRWKTAPFWDKFLGKVEALPLTTIIEEKTVLEKKEWLRKSVAPSLALVYKAFDNDMGQIADMINEGCLRLKERDYDMIRKHQEDIKKTLIASETMKVAEK